MPAVATNVRKLVIENQVQVAFEAIDVRVSGQVRDNLHLLWAQFNFWEKQSNLGLSPPIEERNKVLFAFFSIISELEDNKTLLAIEVNLSKDYEQLIQLNKQGEIDKLLTWLIEKHPEKFRERMNGEANNVPIPVLMTFSNGILQQYIREMSLGITPEQLLNYIVEKMAAMPRFFTEWSSYSEKRMKAKPALEMKIEFEERKYYKQMLLMGIAAGIGGGALALFFTQISDEIQDMHDSRHDYDDNDHTHD